MPDTLSVDDRMAEIERKLWFVMQTLSLTKQNPDGSTDARSLQALYKEMTTHAHETSQTFADVARRAFAHTSPRTPTPDFTGPDGFSGEDDHDSTTGHPV